MANDFYLDKTVSTTSDVVRTFRGGATRDLDIGKPEYHRFLCPEVLAYYCEHYMMPNQETSAGRREADNWKSGMGINVIFASLSRHYWVVWRKWCKGDPDDLQDLCGILFNVQAMIKERLNDRQI